MCKKKDEGQTGVRGDGISTGTGPGGKVNEQLTMEGMLFLAPGGMSTRRSGLRLFMPRFMGGGDLACMLLFMLPGEASRPGELRWWFPLPLPNEKRGRRERERGSHQLYCSKDRHYCLIVLRQQ